MDFTCLCRLSSYSERSINLQFIVYIVVYSSADFKFVLDIELAPVDIVNMKYALITSVDVGR